MMNRGPHRSRGPNGVNMGSSRRSCGGMELAVSQRQSQSDGSTSLCCGSALSRESGATALHNRDRFYPMATGIEGADFALRYSCKPALSADLSAAPRLLCLV